MKLDVVRSCDPFIVDVECVDKSHADLKWRQQALEDCTEVKPDETTAAFWKKRLDSKNILGSFKYPNLRKIIAAIFTLPFSNASVERLFSLLKLIKTSMRNGFKREMLNGSMHTHEGMEASGLHAHQIKLDKDFVRLVRTVKSNAADSEANKMVLKELSEISFD